MSRIKEKVFLKIPLYKLFYIDELHKFKGLTKSELAQFEIDYSVEERRSIVDSLKWGVDNPGFNFSSLLDGITHPNESIYQYICILYNQLKEK